MAGREGLVTRWVTRLAFFVLGSSACSSDFPAPGEVETLRVIAVQKSVPYALPGEDVDFDMLWHDSGRGAGRRVERMWLSGCTNPPGDSYLVCLSFLREALAQGVGPLIDQALESARATPNGRVSFEIPAEVLGGPASRGGEGGEGAAPEATAGAPPEGLPFALDLEITIQIDDVADAYAPFTYQVPEEILDFPVQPTDPRLPPYGLSFVYFAVCAGEVAAAPEDTRGLPFVCKDGDGKTLGSEHFVFGYSQLFVYEDHQNQNPIITGVSFGGEPLPSDLPPEVLCFDPNSVAEHAELGLQACAPVTNRPTRDENGNVVDAGVLDEPLRRPCSDVDVELPTVKVCKEDLRMNCPEHEIRLELDPSVAEEDSLQSASFGEPLEEQMWINYYSDAGNVKSDARVLNDATSGWNDRHATQFYAPEEPGLVYIWAAPHDNRGGVGWARFLVCVE